MSWQLLILLQTLLVASSTICWRILAREPKTANASFVINGGQYIILYVTVLVLVPWLGTVHSDVLGPYWWRFIGGGLAFALTNVCTYKTLVYFDAAVSSIVGSLNAVFTIIGAALFLDEKLTLLQAIGAVVLMVAICYGVLATHNTNKKHVRRSVRLGIMFALLAGLTFGIALVNEKSLLEHMTVGTYGVYGIGGQFLMSVLTAVVFQHSKLGMLKKLRISKWTFLSGLLRGLGGVCFMLSEVRSNNVALVTVISNFKIILVILLGWWLLKERKFLISKLISAVTAIVGVTVMFWQ